METIADNQLCAGYLDGTIKDSCKGDSGGPLVLPLSASDDSAIVIGVVSFGPQGCALKGKDSTIDQHYYTVDIQRQCEGMQKAKIL